jgi:large subunit ribosomal protein L10e
MRRSFGKPVGTAARVRADQTIITVRVNKDSVELAKGSLKNGAAKLPIPCRIVIEKLQSETPLEQVNPVG